MIVIKKCTYRLLWWVKLSAVAKKGDEQVLLLSIAWTIHIIPKH